MKTLSLKLPDELDARLNRRVEQMSTTKSDLTRKALEEYLDGTSESPRESMLELAADLIGSLEGPRDLSYSKKHMRGYGK